MIHRRRPVVILVLLVLLAAGGALASAGDPDSEPPKDAGEKSETEGKEQPANSDAGSEQAPPGEQPEGEVPTFTNEDLERMFGPSDAPETPVGEQVAEEDDAGAGAKNKGVALPDALETIADEQAREKMRKQQITQLEASIDTKVKQVKMLERRILAIRNPLLPPPEANMSEKELEQWRGLTGPQRVEVTEKQLQQARAELAEDQAKLEKLQKQ